MDTFFHENREYFRKRIHQLNTNETSGQDIGNVGLSAEVPDTSVCVRIRPLSSQETEDGHLEGVLAHDYGVAKIYEPRKKVRGKPDLNSTSFSVDEVYGPEKSTKDIYDSRVNELVQWSLEGRTSMLLAYGQTGSGKTFTVTGLEKLLVEELIDSELSKGKEMHVCIFEVSGSNLYDLLNERQLVSVMEDAFGTMQLPGIHEKNPQNAEEFLDIIKIAKELRSTESTSKNDQSSRSHSICRIRIVDKDLKSFDEGTLLLVDLAGSEASSDTVQHSKERMLETRDINKSLSVLKDCITKRALWTIARGEPNQKHVHIPFRSSKLTQILKSAFDVNNPQTCKTIVIACIAPSILDVAHSKNTLRYAEVLKVPIAKAKPMAFDEKIPMTWTNEDVKGWIRKNSPINPKLLAPRENGAQICRVDEDEFTRRALLSPRATTEQAKVLYFKLWTLHIDSRALIQRLEATGETVPVNSMKSTKPKQWRIKPGMFFRLKGEENHGVEMVMVMGLDEEDKQRGGTRYVCAIVSPAGIDGAYELFVTDQVTIQQAELVDEVVLEYDRKTLYYYIKEKLESDVDE